jgi:hypothetical protein
MKKLPIALLAITSLFNICSASNYYNDRSKTHIQDKRAQGAALESSDSDENDLESDSEEVILYYDEDFPALAKGMPAVKANPKNLNWVQRVTTLLTTQAHAETLAEAEKKAQNEAPHVLIKASNEDSTPCPIFGDLASLAHSGTQLFRRERFQSLKKLSVALAEDHFDDEIEKYVEEESAEEYAQPITNKVIKYAHAIIRAGGLHKRFVRDLIQDKADLFIAQAREQDEKSRREDEEDAGFISPKERTAIIKEKAALKKAHGKKHAQQLNKLTAAQDEAGTENAASKEMTAHVKEKAPRLKNAHCKHHHKDQRNGLARHIKREDFRRNKPKVWAQNMQVKNEVVA